MEIVNLIQGTPGWHRHRAMHFNASDAPAMMGVSPYKSRTDLLRELSTGFAPDIDDATQARFDEGHRAEALARPLAEKIIGKRLFPIVGVNGKHSASLDGSTMAGNEIFEHKSLNDAICAANFADELPEHYRIQMEDQFLVSDAERCLFMGSKWNGDTLVDEVHFWYEPDLELRERIVAGWEQFAIDLENYQHVETVPEIIGKAPETLPALRVEVTGMVTASNLAEFKTTALAVFAGISTELVTDKDFSNAEKTVKWCADVESKLEATKEHALSQTASIDELFKTIDDIKETARATRLNLNKLVTERKKSVRIEIMQEGKDNLAAHLAGLNTRIGKPYMPAIAADFALAMKGKKTVASLRGAMSDELATAKIAANEIADRITMNMNSLRELAADHTALFPDTAQIVLKENEDLVSLVKWRIADHEKAELARLEAERVKIREEEKQKLEDKLADEQEAYAIEEEAVLAAEAEQVEPSEDDAKSDDDSVPEVEPEPEQAYVPQKSPVRRRKIPSRNEMLDVLAVHYSTDVESIEIWLQG